MDQDRKVVLYDEMGKEVEATIINVVEINGNNYLLYSVDVNDDEANVYVNKVVRDENGEEDFEPILDEEEKRIVYDALNDMIENMDE